jgi:hypothetical protein
MKVIRYPGQCVSDGGSAVAVAVVTVKPYRPKMILTRDDLGRRLGLN